MSTRASHFVAQANSDLKHAQSMAHSDQSGQALGTSMYLCQQSVEKSLKSVLLSLQERMGLQLGKRGLRSLGHRVYPELYRLYKSNVSPIGLPRLPPKYERLMGVDDAAGRAAARDLRYFEVLSNAWKSKLAKGKLSRLAWRHSVGIPLDQWGLWDLNLFHMPALKRLYMSVFKDKQAPIPVVNEARPTALCARILEDGLSKSDYNKYVADRNYAPIHSTLLGTYETTCDFFGRGEMNFPDVNHIPHSDVARRAVLEFGFRALSLASLPYHILHTHSSMGRYPERLDGGKFTDDVYGEQVEYVIKAVFLEAEYLVWGLCATTAHVDKLWEKGKEAGFW